MFHLSAPTLLFGWHEGHLAWEKQGVALLVVTIWLELCTSYTSSCHRHFHYPQLQQNPKWWHSGTANTGPPGKMAVKMERESLMLEVYGDKIPRFIKFLHHNNRLQSRVTVSFSDWQILFITCNGNMMILIPVFNLHITYPWQLISVATKRREKLMYPRPSTTMSSN